MIERRHITDQAEWLAWRKRDVTASQIGALFNCHPYVTALRLYAEKRGTEFPEPDPDDKALRRGRLLEPVVAQACREHDRCRNWSIEPPRVYLTDTDLRLGATPDFEVIDTERDGVGILQAKTATPHVFERDWLDGTEAPEWVRWQVATEMMLANATWGAIAVLKVDAFDLDLGIIEVERDALVDATIHQAVAGFWARVHCGEEPAPDFERDRETLRALHPAEQAGKTLDLTTSNEFPLLLDERARKTETIKRLTAECKAIETEIAYRMGDAEAALMNGWRATYKTTNYAGYTVAPRSTRVLRIYDKRDKVGGS